MKRKLSFLQYLLLEDENSVIRKVLKATQEDSTKNDFVQTCEKYLKVLDIKLSFDQIEKMSNPVSKNLLKEKARLAAFNYLIA